MWLNSFAERILAMGERKKVIEEKVTAQLSLIAEHLGKIIAFDSPANVQDWTDEISQKFLFNCAKLVRKCDSKISDKEFARWVQQTCYVAVAEASYFVTDPDYKNLRSKATGQELDFKANESELRKLEDILVPFLQSMCKHLPDKATSKDVASKLRDWAIKQRPRKNLK